MKRSQTLETVHPWSTAAAAVAALIGLVAVAGCQGPAPESSTEDATAPVEEATTTTATGAGGHGGGTPAGGAAAATLPSVRLATWNLHNFSKYGPSEFRIDDIASKVEEIGADVMAVQELKVAEGSEGQGTQAWDVLLDELSDHEGLHNPWSTYDTTVGLIYDRSRTTVLASRELFADDGYAFPRAPLEAELVVSDGANSVEMTVIVLHLKAFGDSVDRRRAACAKLDDYLAAQPQDEPVVILGDLNDDPHDELDDNAFAGTFLDAEPSYYFLTEPLPPESVTSLGYYHYVGTTKITGEFLDHIIVNGSLGDLYGTPTPIIHDVPPSQFDDYEWTYSDHFPVVVDLEP